MGAWGKNLIDNDEASDYLIEIGNMLDIGDLRERLITNQISKEMVKNFNSLRGRILAISVSEYNESMILIYSALIKIFDLSFGEDIKMFEKALKNEYRKTDDIERIGYLKALDFAINNNTSFDFNKIVLTHGDKK